MHSRFLLYQKMKIQVHDILTLSLSFVEVLCIAIRRNKFPLELQIP